MSPRYHNRTKRSTPPKKTPMSIEAYKQTIKDKKAKKIEALLERVNSGQLDPLISDWNKGWPERNLVLKYNYSSKHSFRSQLLKPLLNLEIIKPREVITVKNNHRGIMFHITKKDE